MTTQQTRILDYLKTGKTLTNAEAVNKFRAYRLSGQILNLKRKGHDIITIMHYEVNDDGEPIKYGEYKWLGEREDG